MSRVLFFGCPNAYGHTNPTLGLIKELIRQGEHVYYYATDQFKAAIKKTGAIFLPYRHVPAPHEAFSETESAIDPFDRLVYSRLMQIRKTHKYHQMLTHELRNFAVDYIIYDESAAWGKAIAKDRQLPSICSITKFAYDDALLHRYSKIFLQDILNFPEKICSTTDKQMELISRLQKSLLVPPFQRGEDEDSLRSFFSSCSDLNIVYTSKEFQLMGGNFDKTYCFVGATLTQQKRMIDKPPTRKPIVYISLGTSSINIDFIRQCIDAFAVSEWNVIITLGDQYESRNFGLLPANITIYNRVDQIQILSQASCFICHGGMNSVNEALSFAVPLLIVPQRSDQFLVAERIKELGLGCTLQMKRVTPSRLFYAAQEIFHNKTFKDNCLKIQHTLLSAGGARKGARTILEFVNRNKE